MMLWFEVSFDEKMEKMHQIVFKITSKCCVSALCDHKTRQKEPCVRKQMNKMEEFVE